MSATPLFSVIMPAYGVQNCLENAVNSILNQSVNDFEIIIVDDASPDRSGEIADDLCQKYDCIKVLHHKENGGLSQARNTGLSNATGKYVFFMDPDDTVENTLFEEISNALNVMESNVVVFGMVEDYYDRDNNLKNSVCIKYSDKNLFLENAKQVRNEVISLEKKTFYGYAWNKVYNREYLKKINASFENVVLIEDIIFNVKVFDDLESLIILNSTPYHYMKRMDGSLTNKFVPEYYEVHKRRVKTILDQHRNWNCCSALVKNELGCIFARYIISAIQRNFDKRAKMSFKDRRLFIKSIYKDDLYNELILHVKPENRLVKIFTFLLKRKSVLTLDVTGGIVFLVKQKMPIFFSKIKQNK